MENTVNKYIKILTSPDMRLFFSCLSNSFDICEVVNTSYLVFPLLSGLKLVRLDLHKTYVRWTEGPD